MEQILKRHFSQTGHTSFFAIGLNYKKADAEVRGHFSISEHSQNAILKQAQEDGLPSLVVLSTCNRTEIYGFASTADQLINILCKHTQGTSEEFEHVSYVYKNDKAINHLFKVGTGLDSQILGDFEIIAQLRNSFKQSKKAGVMNPFMERLINAVIQASKRIKNETEISSGATSVSFASVQYILARVPYVSEKKILLFGTGKIGRNTCENLVKHTNNKHITLVNRTKDKAEKIAGKFNLVVKDYADIQSEISTSDVLIVATGAQQPTINKELLFLKKPLLILDLSIPKNVSEDVKQLDNVTLVHLDDLSAITDKTLEKRSQQIPQAEVIIAQIKAEFDAWLKARKFAPTIKALKSKLNHIKDAEINFQSKKISHFNQEHAEILGNRLIQKITTQFANHLKNEGTSADDSLDIIQRVFQLEDSTNG